MQVRCNSVNYFTRGQSNSEGQVEQVPAATVSFTYIDPNGSTDQIENFTLTFVNLSQEVDYFPGKDYTLTIAPVVV